MNTALTTSLGLKRLTGLLDSPTTQWLWCALVGVVCCLAAVKLAVLVLGGAPLPQVAFPLSTVTDNPSTGALYPGAARAATDELQDAMVRAELLGVISGEGRAYANMVVNGAPERVFAVGSTLASGVTIEAIETTRVVVREGGVLRRIGLKSTLDSLPSAQARASYAEPGASASGESMSRLAITPVFTQSGQSGVRIEGVNGAIAGLEEGDVVIAVDGVPITALLRDSAGVEALSQRTVLMITVARDTEEITAEISGAAIRDLLAGQPAN